jgi:hypothetical protein
MEQGGSPEFTFNSTYSLSVQVFIIEAVLCIENLQIILGIICTVFS